MRVVRMGVFETNSSSTHSMTVCMKAEYDAWRTGRIYYNCAWGSKSANKDKTFVTREEFTEIIMNNVYPPDIDLYALSDVEFDDWLCENYNSATYTGYTNDGDVEECEFTTPGGETVVAVSVFSYDG